MVSVKDDESCTACRICELVCTYHLGGSFGLGHAGIRVTSSGRGTREIWIHHTPGDPDSLCDECRGEEKPLCVMFCPNEILQEK